MTFPYPTDVPCRIAGGGLARLAPVFRRRPGAGAVLVAWLAIALCLLPLAPLHAERLRVGMKAAMDNADPHVSYTPNRNIHLHVYETLLTLDEHLRARPLLAESWRAVGELGWEFTLRPGVFFHDGLPLTPEDVAFSIMRAKAQTGLRTYASAVRAVASAEATGPRTVLLRLDRPSPVQPALLASVAIVSSRAAAGAVAGDWNGGRAAVGTGPYRWGEWVPGDQVRLVRNERYRGGPEPWEAVTFRFIPNDAARVAALLAGEVDVADSLPPELAGRVREAGMQVPVVDSVFTSYLHLDSSSAVSPNAMDAGGQVLPANPLRDLRVRRAMDHALNRTALAEQAMAGGASPAGQVAAPGLDGHVPGLQPTAFDPALSRALLAEAGYPGGFTLALACTSDRFPGDSRSCQAVGQMLAAVGIRAKVEALPFAVYVRRWTTMTAENQSTLSAAIAMSGSPSGMAIEWMNAVLHSPDPARGLGAANLRFFMDPGLDAMLEQAAASPGTEERNSLMAAALRRAMAERAVLPLFFVKAGWGVRKGLQIVPRQDGTTMATTTRRAM